MAENLKKGDILIDNPAFGSSGNFAIYNGIGTSYQGMINITYVFNHSVSRDSDTWSHFWNKVTKPEDFKAFHQRLSDLGYFYDAETGDVIKKDITDKIELKERLKKYLTNYDRNYDERVCLLRAIENLI